MNLPKKPPPQPNRTFLHPHRLAGLHFHLSVCSQKEPLHSNPDHCSSPNSLKKKNDDYKTRTEGFPGAQWIRISLPVQESWVRSLISEDPACCGGTCPQHLNLCSRAQEPRLLESKHPRPVLLNQRNHHNEKHGHHNQRKSSAAAQTQDNQK